MLEAALWTVSQQGSPVEALVRAWVMKKEAWNLVLAIMLRVKAGTLDIMAAGVELYATYFSIQEGERCAPAAAIAPSHTTLTNRPHTV
jgi:hypothetical protein